MNSRSKGFSVLLILLLTASSLIMAKPAFAQSIPTPSIPQFAVKYANHSDDIPPITTSTTNPYTGKATTTTIPSQYIVNFTLDVTILNQPFPAIINGNASDLYLYYNVRIKGHFASGEDWYYQYPSFPAMPSYTSTGGTLDGSYNDTLPTQSNSQYTVLSFPANYTSGGEIDFQVEALFAYQVTTYQGNYYFKTPETFFTYQSSGWSQTQTFTMPASITSSSTPTPTVPEFSWLVIVPLLLSMFFVAVTIRHRKTAKSSQTLLPT